MLELAKSVQLPKKMRELPRDSRGYPIPFIVSRDRDGKPIFAVNDVVKQTRAVMEKRCPICGFKLDRTLWFVGGPLSALHEQGVYRDSAMHHECMTYALKVCPYLAAPEYLGKVDPEKVMKKLDGAVLIDVTQIPKRPALFVAVASLSQVVHPMTVSPTRPYTAVEYWKHGVRLPQEDGRREAESALAEFKEFQGLTKESYLPQRKGTQA